LPIIAIGKAAGVRHHDTPPGIDSGRDPWLAILVAFVFSLAVGYFNGWMVVKTRLPSFIITLASLYLLRGLTFGLTIALLNYTRASGIEAYLGGDPLSPLSTG
jgi:simple sugar transport system permease protein